MITKWKLNSFNDESYFNKIHFKFWYINGTIGNSCIKKVLQNSVWRFLCNRVQWNNTKCSFLCFTILPSWQDYPILSLVPFHFFYLHHCFRQNHWRRKCFFKFISTHYFLHPLRRVNKVLEAKIVDLSKNRHIYVLVFCRPS